MTVLEGLILGIVQGLTEFLPVSSSGHIELAKAVLDVDPEENLAFTVALHGATVLSTILALWPEIMRLLRGVVLFRWNDETQYAAKILVSMIPVGIVGFLFKEQIKSLFCGNVLLVGFMLLLTAVLLAATYYAPKLCERGLVRGAGKPTYVTALIMGVGQALAVLPGLSRSGTTISVGLLAGVDTREATEFSFLMVLPPIIGMNILDILGGDFAASSVQLAPFMVGVLAAFVMGYLACRWMLKLVRRGKLIWFALYCAAIGLVSIIYSLA